MLKWHETFRGVYSEMKKEEKLEQIIEGKKINELIDKFKVINVAYHLFFKNKNERAALERLTKEYGYHKIIKAVEIVAQTNGEQFAPKINSPCELERKWSKWIAFLWSNPKFKPTDKTKEAKDEAYRKEYRAKYGVNPVE